MELSEFLDHLNSGKPVESGSEPHQFMHRASQEALRITAEINTGYHTPEELRKLPALPSFYMEDLPLAAGEYPIVGRLPLEEGEADHVIRYGKAVPWREAPAVIFQCGPVFRELEGAQPPPHCGRFQHWGVQGRMFTTRELLAQCVAQRSSGPYCREHWNDLRSRAFRPELEAVCAQLGLTVEDLPARLWD